MRKNLIFYINFCLFIAVAVLAVNSFSPPGHKLIEWALAQFGNITGNGNVNYLSRFAGAIANDPSTQIGNSIIYDDGAGHVGIGTTTPGSTLSIGGTQTGPTKIHILQDSGDTVGVSINTAGTNLSWRRATLQFCDNGAGTNCSYVWQDWVLGGISLSATGVSNDLFINPTGNVGIGTAAPNTGLQIGSGGDGWASGLTINSSYPTIYFRDSDNRSAMIHVNGNLMYFLSGCDGASDPASGNTWCIPSGAPTWPFVINMNTGNAGFGRGVVLTPLGADPPDLTNGMMWMRQ